ncbi:MAG: methylaspartate ammonia-lyase [Actinobacteria bacterium]|nr:methylaspartate ammonia-lyase [Actinomycetota bacterium]
MTHVTDVLCVPGVAGFFFDDQRAIKTGVANDGFLYEGSPLTPGFRTIRQAGESISILLHLSNGHIASGDCCYIQYPGAGGRDPLFLAETYSPVLESILREHLIGRRVDRFRPAAEELDGLEFNGDRLHAALRYGATQAWLDAVALAKHLLPCRVLADEYGTEPTLNPIRIFAQTGDDRYTNVDKMILKQVDVLPHGLINNIPDKLGADGGRLLDFVTWLRQRVLTMRSSPGYRPELHVDVYGTLGLIFDADVSQIASYLSRLAHAAEPLTLRIEGPVDMEDRHLHYETLRALREELHRRDIPVEIVADEWCNSLDDIRTLAEMQAVDMIQIKTPVLGGLNNSIEAVSLCREYGLKAYLGGTCNETERSAQLCVHVALATHPYQMLAKPGMGMDEGFMIVKNEMLRTQALLARCGGRM